MKNLSLFFSLTLFLISLCFASPSFSSEAKGTIIAIKGEVKQETNGNTSPLKEGDVLTEGITIHTGANGGAKILLPDKTVLTVGPESSIKAEDIHNKETGTVTVISGQLRSKVVKNLIAAQDQSKKVKFIVRTKTAVMGVRGTDFQVTYHPQTAVTSLITFEGAVAMVKFQEGGSPASAQTLIPILTSEKATVVTEGRYSMVSPAAPEATPPVKFSPTQFESLKQADPTTQQKPDSPSDKKAETVKFSSPIPPGVDAKSFAGTGEGLDKQIIGLKSSERLEGSPSQLEPATAHNAPAAGGYVDLKTGLYTAPPAGSTYDAKQGVYIPPPTVGKIDAATGTFVSAQEKGIDQNKLNQPNPSGPNPASNSASNPATNPAAQNPERRFPSDSKYPNPPPVLNPVPLTYVPPPPPFRIPPPGLPAYGSGYDPSCPFCLPPVTPPTVISPGTRVHFIFNVIN